MISNGNDASAGRETMHDFDVVGYVFEGECYHSDCLDGDLSHEGVVYAGEPEIDRIACAHCGEPLVESFDY
jgi:hypothetical protein